jgi:hypothetical protein
MDRINDILDKITDAARNINQERKKPKNQRNENRSSQNASDTEENTPDKIHVIDFFFAAVKIIEKIFDDRFPGTVLVVRLQSCQSFSYHGLIIAQNKKDAPYKARLFKEW